MKLKPVKGNVGVKFVESDSSKKKYKQMTEVTVKIHIALPKGREDLESQLDSFMDAIEKTIVPFDTENGGLRNITKEIHVD